MKRVLYHIQKIVVGAGIVMLLQSCNNKTPFQTSSVVPAAEGTVKIKQDKNNNRNADDYRASGLPRVCHMFNMSTAYFKKK